MWAFGTALWLIAASALANEETAGGLEQAVSLAVREEQRIIAARELGRMRDARVLPQLSDLLNDSSPQVRLEAALALGRTPGALGLIRQRLEELSTPAATSWTVPRPPELAAELLHSLGFWGDHNDVALLERWLSGSVAVANPAAQAIERMARRKVDGLDSLLPALSGHLWRGGPRLMERAAVCIRRIGVDEASYVQFAETARRHPNGRVRAELVMAVWPYLTSDERDWWVSQLFGEPDSRVILAVLRLLEPGDGGAMAVTSWLQSPDKGVRREAIAALGRLGGDEAIRFLRAHLATVEAAEYAATLSALHHAGAKLPDRTSTQRSKSSYRRLVSSTGDQSQLLSVALDRRWHLLFEGCGRATLVWGRCGETSFAVRRCGDS